MNNPSTNVVNGSVINVVEGLWNTGCQTYCALMLHDERFIIVKKKKKIHDCQTSQPACQDGGACRGRGSLARDGFQKDAVICFSVFFPASWTFFFLFCLNWFFNPISSQFCVIWWGLRLLSWVLSSCLKQLAESASQPGPPHQGFTQTHYASSACGPGSWGAGRAAARSPSPVEQAGALSDRT